MGRPIPLLADSGDGENTVFGGIATDLQPSQSACCSVQHTQVKTMKFMEVSVVIHGRVDCFINARALDPKIVKYAILARWYAPTKKFKSDRFHPYKNVTAGGTLIGDRPTPNATLFVV